MAELEVPKGVSKVTLGGDTVWQNSDGWVPLKLPDGVSGTVFFKDAGDGSGLLAGAMSFLYKGPIIAIVPPKGYQFTSINWNDHGDNSTPGMRCLSSETNIGERYASVFVLPEGLKFELGTGTGSVTFSFPMIEAMTLKDSHTAKPAIIRIKKV